MLQSRLKLTSCMFFKLTVKKVIFWDLYLPQELKIIFSHKIRQTIASEHSQNFRRWDFNVWLQIGLSKEFHCRFQGLKLHKLLKSLLKWKYVFEIFRPTFIFAFVKPPTLSQPWKWSWIKIFLPFYYYLSIQRQATHVDHPSTNVDDENIAFA